MPEGVQPVLTSADGGVVEYRDVAFGDTHWSRVVMHFDAAHHLNSMSFRSTTMDFDTLKQKAQTQYDSYVEQEMKASLTSGASISLMQVRICEQPGEGVVMTFEEPTSAL